MALLTDGQLDDLRRSNPTDDVARRLGANLRRSGGKLVGSCPMCGGGRLAKRFEVKADKWVCAVCADGGDVISLAEKVLGLTFRQAVDWLGGARVLTPEEEDRLAKDRAAREAKAEKEQNEYRERERSTAYGIWTRAVSLMRHELAAPGRIYFRERGIDWPDTVSLRYAPELPYFHGKEIDERGREHPRVIYRGPAVIAAILRPDDRFGAAHCTYIDPARPGTKAEIFDPDTGELLEAKKSRGSTQGGRIELIMPQGCPLLRLFNGEGIETVGSVYTPMQRLGRLREGDGFWTSIDLGNLGGRAMETVPHPTLKHKNGRTVRVPGPDPDRDAPAWPLPETVRELVTLGDGDSDPFLTQHAHTRCRRRYARPGLTTRTVFAPAGLDFNDVLRGKAAKVLA